MQCQYPYTYPLYTLRIPPGTPLHAADPHAASGARAAVRTEKDAPAMALASNLISHERVRETTVKRVVIYDAEVCYGTYPSVLTNKEEKRVTLH